MLNHVEIKFIVLLKLKTIIIMISDVVMIHNVIMYQYHQNIKNKIQNNALDANMVIHMFMKMDAIILVVQEQLNIYQQIVNIVLQIVMALFII